MEHSQKVDSCCLLSLLSSRDDASRVAKPVGIFWSPSTACSTVVTPTPVAKKVGSMPVTSTGHDAASRAGTAEAKTVIKVRGFMVYGWSSGRREGSNKAAGFWLEGGMRIQIQKPDRTSPGNRRQVIHGRCFPRSPTLPIIRRPSHVPCLLPLDALGGPCYSISRCHPPDAALISPQATLRRKQVASWSDLGRSDCPLETQVMAASCGPARRISIVVEWRSGSPRLPGALHRYSGLGVAVGSSAIRDPPITASGDA